MKQHAVTVRAGGNLTVRDANDSKLFLEPGDSAFLPERAILQHFDRLILHDDTWFRNLAPTPDDPPEIAYRKGRPQPNDACTWPTGLTLPGRPEVTLVLLTNTHRPRQELRATLRSLKRVGAYPVVFSSSEHPHPTEQRRAAWHALLRAYIKGEHALFLEDDIEVSEVFRLTVFMAVMQNSITYLYIPDSCTPPNVREVMREGEPLTVALQPFPLKHREALHQPKGYYDSMGSQAVFIPKNVLAAIIEDPSYWTSEDSFDIWLRKAVRQRMEQERPPREWVPHIAIPNSVQHRHAPTLVTQHNPGRLRNRPAHKSSTFGYPYVKRRQP